MAETSTIDPMTGGELSALGVAAALRCSMPGLGKCAAGTARRTDGHRRGAGCGATRKLAVNDVLHAANQALTEAMVLAEKAGVERETACEVFANNAVTSPFVLNKRAVSEQPGEAPVAFSRPALASRSLRTSPENGRIGSQYQREGITAPHAAASRMPLLVAGALADGDRKPSLTSEDAGFCPFGQRCGPPLQFGLRP